MAPRILSPNHCNICTIKKCDLNSLEKEGNDNLNKPLKTCSGCKLISYCSLEHQKLDWKRHMDLCRAVQTILISKPIDCEDSNFVKAQYLHEFTKGPIKSIEQLLEATWKIQLILEKLLKRKLYYYERELITFPRICPNCLKFKVNEKYKCYQCNEVTYCCKTCLIMNAKSHFQICNDLKIYYNFYDIKEIDLNFLYNYNSIDLENINLMEYLQNFTEIKIPKTPKNLQEFQIFSTACNYSYVSTVLKLIRQFNFLPNKIKDNDFAFTIFFVGAKDELKYFKVHHCKFLLSQLPTIKKLKLVFIGPELKVPPDVNKTYEFQFEKVKFRKDKENLEADEKYFKKNCCTIIGNEGTTGYEDDCSIKSYISTPSCQTSPSTQSESSNKSIETEKTSTNTSDTESQDEIDLPIIETREVQFELLRTYFEDYLEGINLNYNFIANLVICFNCQFNEFCGEKNTWKYAIKTFLQMKRTPIVFTSRTKLESKLDMKCIFDCVDDDYQKEKYFNIIKSNEINKLCDFRPFRNHEYFIDDEIYYQNGYINAVLGKSDEFNIDLRNRWSINTRAIKNISGKKQMTSEK